VHMNSFTPIWISRYPPSFWKCGIEWPAMMVSVAVIDCGGHYRRSFEMCRVEIASSPWFFTASSMRWPM
jgi:hypothetical protein